MRADDIASLSRAPLFAGLRPGTLERLSHHALMRRLLAGTELFDQGERPLYLHVLLEGSVELLGRSSEYRETVVELLTPVDAFILAAALTDTPYLMAARVVTASRVVLLRAETLRQQLVADPALSLAMLASLSCHYQGLVRQVKNLKLRSTTQRLGCYLLSLTGRAGKGGSVRLPFDKRRIASQLGMSAETLSRTLAALRPYGVQTFGGQVTLRSPALLAAHCRHDRLIDEVDKDLRVEVKEKECGWLAAAAQGASAKRYR